MFTRVITPRSHQISHNDGISRIEDIEELTESPNIENNKGMLLQSKPHISVSLENIVLITTITHFLYIYIYLLIYLFRENNIF